MIPTNVFAASTSNGSILAIIFFAIVFSVGVVKTGGESGAVVAKFFNGAYDVMLTVTTG
ncbi:MAG: cation:dicarboxylase symporter family transporter, partial [SAR324 cluster bacterium]|nr:cation:dicarboxylase symporter family transporter [SAR324 cluster bacterium]